MLQDYQLLRIPGPTPIPPSVERAMAQPMIGHRGSETSKMIQNIKPGLKKVFGTKQDVLMITGSGTSGLEAAIVNVVKPGDKVLVVATGVFGQRFTKICQAYQIDVEEFAVEWGTSLNPTAVKDYLKERQDITAVFSTYCETSTGVINPVGELAKAVHEVSEALVIVDGVSCMGGIETKMDEWGIDVLVTGSQKAFMLPAGLNFIGVSDRAWKIIEVNPKKGFYLDLTKYRDNIEKDTTPFTPALSLLFGLEQVLKNLEAEGFEEVYKRHALMRDMTRAAFKALDIPLFTTDADASPTVTAVKPVDFDAEAFRKVLKTDFNLSVAGGQQHLKGQIFRVGHMGYCAPTDVLQTLAAIEIALVKIGKEIELGKGLAAAQKVYLEGANN
ncbi:alanine--glyoxylate aminotransferase family protein [Viridibacillus sp. FSL E2-0187]|uniref:pyridoxal-phosphate-dependent aminotransferase family protein n=1 Tax=Viridibacillus sp. FSL E2-0187 TaxID=2921362 RepID=UPI0030FB825A